MIKRTVYVIGGIIILALLLAANGCSILTMLDNIFGIEPIVGTWVNTDYNGMENPPGKIIISIDPDGHLNGKAFTNDFDDVTVQPCSSRKHKCKGAFVLVCL